MPTHLVAHLQFSQANAKTKTCKRACLPQRTADRKDAAKMKDRTTRDKNGQLVINRALSGAQHPAPKKTWVNVKLRLKYIQGLLYVFCLYSK